MSRVPFEMSREEGEQEFDQYFAQYFATPPQVEPTLWTCTNCGKRTYDIIFEEGDSNICHECYDRFGANEPRHDQDGG